MVLNSDVRVPANSEILVEGRTKENSWEGKQVLVEPGMDEDSPTNIPFTVCRVSAGGLALRLANVSNQEVTVRGPGHPVLSIKTSCQFSTVVGDYEKSENQLVHYS